MGAYALPTPSAPGAGGALADDDPSQLYGPSPWSRYYPWAQTDPNASIESIAGQNRNIISSGANQLDNQAAAQENYYGQLQPAFQSAQDAALNQLNTTPGYTDAEAAAIQGDPNAPVTNLTTNQEGIGAQLNQYQADEGGLANGLPARYQTQVGDLAGGLNRGQQVLQGGLSAAQGKFGALDTAVGNPALDFDPNSTEKQLTDRDVQDLQTSAMTAVGNRYRTAEDTLERQAAEQGNTSPAALNAMRQANLLQEGAAAGDAATNAKIAALNAQYGRAAGIEAQREGATQTQAGLEATAATTEEAAAQAAAGTAGQAALTSANTVGQAGLSAEEQAAQQQLSAEQAYGQFSTNTAAGMAGQQLSAQQLAEQQQSQRAGDVAGARIAGQNQYRSGVAQQQGMAQQGGQAAQQTQLGTYGTMTSGLNQSTSGQANFEVGKPSAGDTLAKDASAWVAPPSSHAEGAIITKPEIARIGERGPEMVIPIGPRYKSSRDLGKRAA